MKYIGIDVGGTNIKGALVSESGELLKEFSAAEIKIAFRRVYTELKKV